MTKVEEATIANTNFRRALLATQKVIGKEDLNAVLYTADLSRFVNRAPEDNLSPAVTFEEYARFNTAIEDRYGRGAKGVLKRIGEEMFRYTVKGQSTQLGVARTALRLMSKPQRIRLILNSMVSAVQETNPNVHAQVEETDGRFSYIEHKCAICEGRKGNKPICHLHVGELGEAVRWAAGERYEMRETRCIARGDAVCRFEVSERAR